MPRTSTGCAAPLAESAGGDTSRHELTELGQIWKKKKKKTIILLLVYKFGFGTRRLRQRNTPWNHFLLFLSFVCLGVCLPNILAARAHATISTSEHDFHTCAVSLRMCAPQHTSTIPSPTSSTALLGELDAKCLPPRVLRLRQSFHSTRPFLPGPHKSKSF